MITRLCQHSEYLSLYRKTTCLSTIYKHGRHVKCASINLTEKGELTDSAVRRSLNVTTCASGLSRLGSILSNSPMCYIISFYPQPLLKRHEEMNGQEKSYQKILP